MYTIFFIDIGVMLLWGYETVVTVQINADF